VTSPFLAAGHTGAHIEQTGRLDRHLTALAVTPFGVASVDDDIAGFKHLEQTFDHRVDRSAGFDEQHDSAGALDRCRERGKVMRRHQGRIGVPGNEVVGHALGPIVDRDRVAVIDRVEDQVLAHHGQPDQAEVGTRCGCLTRRF